MLIALTASPGMMKPGSRRPDDRQADSMKPAGTVIRTQAGKNMTADDVEAIIARELEDGDFDNWHGITGAGIDAYLVPPVLEDYEDGLDQSRVRSYWTVLHEDPSGKEGYTVFYSEEDRMFGLAVAGKTARYASIGLYGSFLETLSGM